MKKLSYKIPFSNIMLEKLKLTSLIILFLIVFLKQSDAQISSSVSFTYSEITGNNQKTLYPANKTGFCSPVEYSNVKVKSRVALGEKYIFGSQTTTVSVDYEVRVYNSSSTLLKSFREIAVLSNTNVESVREFDLTGIASTINNVVIDIISNSVSGPSGLNGNLLFESKYTENMLVDASSLTCTTTSCSVVSGTNNQRRNFVFSSPCSSTRDYQFQMLKVNHNEIIDWSRALNIELKNLETTAFPLNIMEGSGYYIWRVRAIGNKYEGNFGNSKNWGNWSSITGFTDGTTFDTLSFSSQNFIFKYTQTNENINFVYSRSFQESNPDETNGFSTAEQISFVDGLNKLKQKQSLVNSKSASMVNQTIYDYSGRPAINTMPIPLTSKNHLEYYHSLVKDQYSNIYEASDFDQNSNLFSPSSVDPTGPISYYDGYVLPSPYGYPYARTIYSYDNLNRVKEQSGIGAVMRIQTSGDRHTTRTHYTAVAEDELIRVFGNEAPIAERVKKTITVDPNGSKSVTYLDEDDKVIATCLSATNSTLLEKLPSYTESEFNVVDVITKKMLLNNSLAVTSKPFTLLEEILVDIDYEITPEQISTNCETVCKNCDYKVNIKIINMDEGTIAFHDSVILGFETCGTNDYTHSFSVTLPEGNYLLEKRLSSHNKFSSTTELDDFLQSTRSYYESNILTSAYTNLLSDLNSGDLLQLYENLFAEYGPGYFQEKLEDPNLENEVVEVAIGCYTTIKIPIKLCERKSCADRNFEAYFVSQYVNTNPDYYNPSHASYFMAASSYRDAFNTGDFNTLVANMIADGYTCDSLWDIWTALVNSYDFYMDIINSEPTDPCFTEYDIITEFLERAGYRFEANEVHTDYNTVRPYAYKYLFYPGNVSPTQLCEDKVFESGGDIGNITPQQMLELYHCHHSRGPCAGEIGNENDFEPALLDTAAVYASRCVDSCEAKRASIRAELIQTLHNGGFYIENDAYELIIDPNFGHAVFGSTPRSPGSNDIRLSEIDCMEEALVQLCKDACVFDLDYSGGIPVIGTPEQQQHYTNVLTGNFSMGILSGSTISVDNCDVDGAIGYDPNSCANIEGLEQLCYYWKTPFLESETEITYANCEEQKIKELRKIIEDQIATYLNWRVEEARDMYLAKCNLLNTSDKVTMSYPQAYYHYTLYYYDRNGNLVKTVPPKGVELLDKRTPPAMNRETSPNHTFVTKYEYNSYNQVIAQESPDGGKTNFYYNKKGQLRFSVNAQQLIDNRYSYTKYDALGNIIETGEATKESDLNTYLTDAYSSYPSLSCSVCAVKDVIQTIYNTPGTVAYMDDNNKPQRFLQNRVSYALSDEDGNLSTKTDQVITYYSYDANGNVEWIAQELPNMFKCFIGYEYDVYSNKVTKVKMNEGRRDAFYHMYTYDQDNRLKEVKTSTDNIYWDRDAKYEYYTHGPLKRVVYGEDDVQGMDYDYTLEGWLKMVNNSELIKDFDPGEDAVSGSANSAVAKDAFGYHLSYYHNDHARDVHQYYTEGPGANYSLNNPLYNGNITRFISNAQVPVSAPSATQPLSLNFRYDDVHRLLSNTSEYMNTSIYDVTSTNDYISSYDYDANGNITSLSRNGHVGSGGNILMDDITYNYSSGTTNNKLTSITENANSEVFTGDIQNGGNYQYDAIGNLIYDDENQIDGIAWTPYNKVRYVASYLGNATTSFLYDAMGQRVRKLNDQVGIPEEYYIRDASGNIMAIYERTGSTYILKEVPIYASGRIGIYKPNLVVAQKSTTITLQDDGSNVNDNYVKVDADIYAESTIMTVKNFYHQNVPLDKTRSFVNFYLNSLKSQGSNITDAKLSLYGSSHYLPSTSSSTYAKIERVTQNWGETSIRWDDQPTVTSTNKVDLASPTTTTQDYLNIDVTNLIKDMVDHSTNPLYGLRIALTDESAPFSGGNTPAGLAFYTSEYGTSSKRPKLVITLSSSVYFFFAPQSFNAKYERTVMNKYYELTDHLGNVHVVVNDRKLNDGSFFKADVIAATDYYPFGMAMPKRTFPSNTVENGGYRFGFNGQEKDDDFNGISGTFNTAQFWEYDTRLGRRWNLDPVDKPWQSRYHAFSNSPIWKVDPNGDNDDWVQDAEGQIKWDKDANSQETTKKGEKYLGKDLTFTFNSYIDKKTWDGPLGSFPAGDKLTSTITLKSNENANGELISIDIESVYDVKATGGIFQGKNSFPGLRNTKIDTKGLRSGFVVFEQHAMVNGFEEFGLKLMGYDPVNVAQKLIIGINGNNLNLIASTDVFPSATLSVNGIQLFNYAQPSFLKTHGKTREILDNGMGGIMYNDKSNRPKPSFYNRYKN